MVSLPAPPIRTSLPAPPLSLSVPSPPVMVLSRLLPIPVKLLAGSPMKVRFSTLALMCSRQRRVDAVDAGIHALEHEVTGIADAVGVVAGATEHDDRAGSGGEQVVPRGADYRRDAACTPQWRCRRCLWRSRSAAWVRVMFRVVWGGPGARGGGDRSRHPNLIRR